MEPETTAAPPVQPVETDPSLRRRTSCFDVFKKFSKSAWRKIGASGKESRPNAAAHGEPPIESLVVDDDIENAPPTEKHPNGSGFLEVDPNETSEFTFEATAPVSLSNAASRDRMSALCARYGLPYDGDAMKPSPYALAPSGQLRVPKRTRQRVRVSCHVCKAVFKGERVCQKCGHGKCEDCNRRHVTEPKPSSEKAVIVSIDSSEDDSKSTASSKDADSEHSSSMEMPESEEPLPVIERSKYTCHKCFGEFASATNALCGLCGHEKCHRCSREVVHITSPYDGEGERANAPRQHRVYRPCKQRVRHFCDHCGEMFAPNRRVCSACSHTRCKSCTRSPNKRRRLDTRSEPASTAPVEPTAASASASDPMDESVS